VLAASALIALLAASAAQDVTVEPQPDGRLRLTIVFATANSELYVRAMLRLRQAAERQCRGRGRPVSEGALEANRVPGRRDRLALSETYACAPPAAN
jgi:redox-regulated HSP33 family molecular chaperone